MKKSTRHLTIALLALVGLFTALYVLILPNQAYEIENSNFKRFMYIMQMLIFAGFFIAKLQAFMQQRKLEKVK